jgi:hypothetical protein
MQIATNKVKNPIITNMIISFRKNNTVIQNVAIRDTFFRIVAVALLMILPHMAEVNKMLLKG